MYTAIRRYTLTDSSVLDEIVQRVENEFVPMMRGSEGFVAYSLLSTGGTGLVTISVFQDQAGAEASTAKAREWVNANLAHFVQGSPQIDAGEVRVLATAEHGG